MLYGIFVALIRELGNIQRKPTAQTAHLVFADTKANAEKNQKSCFLPTLERNNEQKKLN